MRPVIPHFFSVSDGHYAVSDNKSASSHPEDIGKTDTADAHPKQYALYERLDANAAQRLPCERRSDEEQRESDEMLGEFRHGTAELATHRRRSITDQRGVAQDVGIEEYRHHKPDDEARHTAIPWF